MARHELLCVFLLGLLGSIAVSAPLEAARKNVVLFVTDDQSPDAGCYGNPVVRTPSLDALASVGTRFTHAFCTTASCSASRSVILTGRFNHRIAQYGHAHTYHHFRTYDDVPSLPVLLSQIGYRTARIGKFHVGPESVYRFDVTPEGRSTRPVPSEARNPVAMAEQCREFLSADDERPFFLYFGTSDPHRGGGQAQELPHAPDRFGNLRAGEKRDGIEPVVYRSEDVIVPPFLPDTPECRAELAQYYQSISRVDQGLGRLRQVLEDTGHWDDTLVIYISDHGMAFPGAKTTVYEPGLRSPCIVRNPYAKKRGGVTDAMVSWVDLAPTILDFCGAPPSPEGDFDGRSFLGVLEKEHPEGWDEIYASHTFHEVTMYYPMRVVRTRNYKLIWNIAHGLPYPFASDLWAASTWKSVYKHGPDALYGKRTVRAFIERAAFELYDLKNDPHEVKNLAANAAHAGRLLELKNKLRTFQETTDDPWRRKWRYE